MNTPGDHNTLTKPVSVLVSAAALIASLSAASVSAAPLGPQNLTYEGSFRVPSGNFGGSTFAYGGNALAWRDRNPNDPNDAGSLYMVGHEQHQQVAEIAIPTPVKSPSKSVAALPVAKLLQPFADITGGLGRSINDDPRIGGLAWLDRGGNGGELHWTLWKFYNVAGQQLPGHGKSSVNLNAPNATGAWTLGNYHNQSTAGYLFSVPDAWARQNLGGKRLVAGQNSVTGNATSSWGPSMFAYAPWLHAVQPAPPNAALDVSVMANYPYSADGSNNFPGYEPTDFWGGASWISAGGEHAIVVVGSKALGPTRYGQPQPGDCSQYQGYHGDPYEPQILFFDVNDLVDSANGRRDPASIRASALYKPQADIYKSCTGLLSGAAFDPDRQRLYIVQPNADNLNQYEPLPLVHVYKVSSNGGGGGGGGTPVLTMRDVQAEEGAGPARVVVQLDRPAPSDISFTAFSRPVSAQPGADYRGFTVTQSIAAGQSRAVVNVDLIDDSAAEANEALNVRLIDVKGDVTVSDAVSRIDITDDDPYTGPAFSVSGDYIDESEGRARVRVELYRPVDADVRIFTQTGTATGGGKDYAGFSRILRFRNGERVKFVDVEINDDSEVEKREYLLIRLTEARGAGIAIGRRLIWIQDND